MVATLGTAHSRSCQSTDASLQNVLELSPRPGSKHPERCCRSKALSPPPSSALRPLRWRLEKLKFSWVVVEHCWFVGTGGSCAIRALLVP